MRKKYILLKDAPEIKKGAGFEEECDDGDQDYICSDGKYIVDYIRGCLIRFSKTVVEKQPEWFEKIENIEVPKQHLAKVKKFVKSLK